MSVNLMNKTLDRGWVRTRRVFSNTASKVPPLGPFLPIRGIVSLEGYRLSVATG